MNNDLGKIFITNNNYANDDFESFYQSSNFLITKYNYNQPNSYIDLINRADALGFEQLTLPPSYFFVIMKKLVENSYRVKSIHFDPPLEEEDQDFFDRRFENALRDVHNGHEGLNTVKVIIDNYNKELHSIPQKLSFLSNQGNGYTIYNNGVLDIEDEEEINEIGIVLSSFINEVQSR